MMSKNTWRRLGRDRSGAAAVELAAMLPLLFSMVFGAFDIGSGFAMKLALEQAAGRSAELATAPGTVSNSYANLSTEVASAYGKPYLTASAANWLECNGVKQGSFTVVCGAGQQRARYVSVVITAEYVPFFNYLGLLTGGGPNGGFITQGDAVVRIQ